MIDSSILEPVLERILAGDAPSDRERRALLGSTDILTLGTAADELRRRRHGARVTFLRVAEASVEDMPAAPAWPAAAGEIRLRGAVSGAGAAVEAVARAAAAAGGVPVSGFSLAEIERAAEGDAARAGALMVRLREAGLTLVSEAPIDDLADAVGMAAAVVDAGLQIARVTMRRASDPAALLERAGGFFRARPECQVFAPLPRTFSPGAPTTGYTDTRLVALSRILLPVPHIQVDWTLYGPKLAQVAIAFGADDLDAVSPLDETTEGRRRAPRVEVVRNIEAAGAQPAERDGRFRLRS